MSDSDSKEPNQTERLHETTAAKRKKDIYLESHLKTALSDDPRLRDDTDITVNVENLGIFKGTRVQILGKVRTEEKRKAAEEVVRSNIEKRTEVRNELKVE